MAKQIKTYKEQVIVQKDPIDAIRSRAAMYVGSLENANVLLREITDNSLDELVSDNSPCNSVWIYRKPENQYIVCDNGRGLPLQKSNTDPKVTMAVQAVTSLHSGSKFDKTDVQIGLNGVGSKCVNALSIRYEFFVKINKNKIVNTTKKVEDLTKNSGIPLKDSWYYCRFEKGRIKEETFVNTSWIEEYLNIELDPSTANIVSFIPDTTIYESGEAEIPSTLKFIHYISTFNNSKVNIYVDGKKYTDFFNPFEIEFDAILVSQKENAKNKEATFLCSLEIDKNECGSPKYVGSVNGLDASTGVHIKLFDTAFDLAIAKIYGESYVKYAKHGLRFSVVTLCAEPEFSSQIKTSCSGIPGIDKKCIEPLSKKILKVIKDNKQDFDLHIERIRKIMASHQNLGKIEYIKERLGGILADNPKTLGKLPRCVVDCSTKDRKKANLFIVEGNSAAGNLLAGRDSRYDAVLMLRGKLLNTSDMDIKKALDNEEIRGLIQAIGVGVDDYYSTEKVRYGKIFLLTDADADGAHIGNLILGLFGKHMKFLLKEKFVYILETPLYKQGNKFFFSGEEHLMDPNLPSIHFKGLGEWAPKDFKEVCLGKNRREVLVTPENCDLAIEYLSSTKKKNELMVEENIIEL